MRLPLAHFQDYCGFVFYSHIFALDLNSIPLISIVQHNMPYYDNLFDSGEEIW